MRLGSARWNHEETGRNGSTLTLTCSHVGTDSSSSLGSLYSRLTVVVHSVTLVIFTIDSYSCLNLLLTFSFVTRHHHQESGSRRCSRYQTKWLKGEDINGNPSFLLDKRVHTSVHLECRVRRDFPSTYVKYTPSVSLYGGVTKGKSPSWRWVDVLHTIRPSEVTNRERLQVELKTWLQD